VEKKHIILTGSRGVGKTTLLEKLLSCCSVPVYGFVTRSTPRREDGFHSIYLHPADGSREQSPDNHIGDCCYGRRTTHPEVFSSLGIQYLTHKADGIIAMDELGFMETDAPDFCQAVLNCFDGDVPVLAVCKDKPGVPFLEQVLAHPKAQVYQVTEENRDVLYEKLRPVIERYN